MGRGGDSREPDLRVPERSIPSSRHARQSSSSRGSWTHAVALPRGQERELVVTRTGAYRLRDSEARTLVAAGTFRAVRLSDLVEFVYRGDGARAERDVRQLRMRHLVETRVMRLDRRGQPATLIALTRTGRGLLNGTTLAQADGPSRSPQRFYSGWVKPAELRHDAALYRMVQLERQSIEAKGGRITRVILDAELKRRIGQALGTSRQATTAQKREVAEAHDLRVVRGRLQIPDVRLEIEWPDGRHEHRDLELITEHYHRRHLAGKAGCRCYAVGPDPHIVTRMLDV